MRQGYITISRPSFGTGKEAILIRVGDKDSLTTFLEVEIGYREFAQVLTGQGHTPCCYEEAHLERIGKVREHKTELIPLPQERECLRDAPRLLLAPYEVEGWVGNEKDLVNGNRQRRQPDGTTVAVVTFIRYVEKGNGDAVSGDGHPGGRTG